VPLLALTNGVYGAGVAGPDTPFSFVFTLGDYRSDSYAVDIRIPAAILDGSAQIEPPRYTGLGRRAAPLGNLTVPEGSAVSFRLTPTKPIRYCDLVLGGARRVPFQKTTNGVYRAATRADESGLYEIAMTGLDDLPNSDRVPYALSVQKDAPPRVEVAHPKANSFLCPLSLLQIEFDVKDDYGIASASLDYEVYRKRSRDDEHEFSVKKGNLPVELAGHGRDEHVRVVRQMKEMPVLIGDRIVFRAAALDNREGKPSRGESDEIPVFIVSAEELRGILESEQARVSALMRKLRDDEQKQAEAIQRRVKEPTT